MKKRQNINNKSVKIISKTLGEIMIFEKFEKENITSKFCDLKKFIKSSKTLRDISKDNSGQGAAEYILLFGGVIVIALAGLLIYRSYFSNTSGLNATEDISSIRNNMTSLY